MKNKIEKYLEKIIISLKKIDPVKIILFGSQSTNEAASESDIDLIVILNKTNIPKNYDEKLDNKVLVRESILNLSMEIPIDLLVYSIPEYEKLKRLNSHFSKEIDKKGKILYEKPC